MELVWVGTFDGTTRLTGTATRHRNADGTDIGPIGRPHRKDWRPRRELHRGARATRMRPDFSVLIPTRDRLEYLVQAIETVRRQDFSSWETVISDNASQQRASSHSGALADPRILCFPKPDAIPVTQKW